MALEIVLYDRSPVVQKIFSHVLYHYGPVIHRIDQPARLLETLKSHKPDMIFMDHSIARSLNDHPPAAKNPALQKVPIILMAKQELNDSALKSCSARSVLKKPISAAALKNLVTRFVPKTKSHLLKDYLQFPPMPDFENTSPAKPPSDTHNAKDNAQDNAHTKKQPAGPILTPPPPPAAASSPRPTDKIPLEPPPSTTKKPPLKAADKAAKPSSAKDSFPAASFIELAEEDEEDTTIQLSSSASPSASKAPAQAAAAAPAPSPLVPQKQKTSSETSKTPNLKTIDLTGTPADTDLSAISGPKRIGQQKVSQSAQIKPPPPPGAVPSPPGALPLKARAVPPPPPSIPAGGGEALSLKNKKKLASAENSQRQAESSQQQSEPGTIKLFESTPPLSKNPSNTPAAQSEDAEFTKTIYNPSEKQSSPPAKAEEELLKKEWRRFFESEEGKTILQKTADKAVWQVVPELAKQLITKELNRLLKEQNDPEDPNNPEDSNNPL